MDDGSVEKHESDLSPSIETADRLSAGVGMLDTLIFHQINNQRDTLSEWIQLWKFKNLQMIKGDEVKIYVIAVLIISQNAKNYSNIVSWVKYCDSIVLWCAWWFLLLLPSVIPVRKTLDGLHNMEDNLEVWIFLGRQVFIYISMNGQISNIQNVFSCFGLQVIIASVGLDKVWLHNKMAQWVDISVFNQLPEVVLNFLCALYR